MNTHKMKLAVWLFVFSFLMPQTSEAYFTTNQSAVRLTNDTVLYTVSYAFGFTDRALYMPIMAIRQTGNAVKQNTVEYNILNDGEVITSGMSNALVLVAGTDAEIREQQYYLEPGEAATFTLVALLTIPKDSDRQKEDLSLLVTHLPFTTVKGEKTLPGHLNPSELQYYRTPEVKI